MILQFHKKLNKVLRISNVKIKGSFTQSSPITISFTLKSGIVIVVLHVDSIVYIKKNEF